MPLHDDILALLQELSAESKNQPDLARGVDHLLSLAVLAVPRCLGLALTVDREGLPVTLIALTATAALDPVMGSLALHLPRGKASGTAGDGPVLILYSGNAGAFERLRVDLLALLDLDPRRAVTDANLSLPDLADPMEAVNVIVEQLDDVAVVERALGVLLDQAHLPEQCRAELAGRAEAQGLTVPDAARFLLATVSGPAARRDDDPVLD
jgi:hypothetical protein